MRTDTALREHIDYANERLDACVFYTNEGEGSGLEPGTYLVEILEEDVVIGSSQST